MTDATPRALTAASLRLVKRRSVDAFGLGRQLTTPGSSVAADKQTPWPAVFEADYVAIATLACERHGLRLAEHRVMRAQAYLAWTQPAAHQDASLSRGAEVLKIKRLGRGDKWGIEEAAINRDIAAACESAPHSIATFLGSDELNRSRASGDLYLVMRFRAYPKVCSASARALLSAAGPI